MSKNYMEQVAKMLGVELGEEFRVKSDDGTTIGFTVKELYTFSSAGVHAVGDSRLDSQMLDYLIKGKCEIVKLPWKPKDGEQFYFITCDYCVQEAEWCGGLYDLVDYKLGNCFKTKEEITPEVIERYKAFLNNGERIEW